jgi:deazaflavin-dependent oxidoreductase (nitroreductase family)
MGKPDVQFGRDARSTRGQKVIRREDFPSQVAYNEAVIEQFRANHGQLEGRDGMDMLLLTTTGAKTKAARVSPLVYTTDGEAFIVCASDGGAAHNPSWYYNLLAEPQATIEVADRALEVRARVVDEAERERLLARPLRQSEVCKEHQATTSRLIPLVALEPI